MMQSTTAKRFCATIAVSSRSSNFYSTTVSTVTAFEPSSPPPPRHLPRLSSDAIPTTSTTSSGNSSGSSNGNAQGQAVPLPSLLSVTNSQTAPPGSSPTDRSGSSLNNNNSSKFNPSAVPPTTWPAAALHAANASNTDTAASSKGKERETRQVFTLDVGAYGIPKRGRGWSTNNAPEFDALDLAVQVGEDAYFIRDDAMGVADGVGGWTSRHSNSRYASRRPGPSPSALFARRLMHFCALELKETNVRRTKNAVLAAERRQQRVVTSAAGSSTRLPSLRSPLLPRSSTPSQQAATARKGNARPFLWPWEHDSGADQQQDKNTTLTESATENENFLGMGDNLIGIGAKDPTSTSSEDKKVGDEIDPVEILENAYRRTISAHRVRASTSSTPSTSGYSSPERPSSPSPSSSSTRYRASLSPSSSKTSLEIAPDGTVPLREGSSTALVAVLAGSTLRVAHLGDCAALLVRAGEVIWRSEEMWWAFNHPLQLGPRSPATPLTHARSYDVPVQEGDIVILCSDGMSDNLWEEDVVEEVRRFGGVWDLGDATTTSNGLTEKESGLERRGGVGTKKPSEVLAEESHNGGLPTPPPSPPLRPFQTNTQTLFTRQTFAGMLSEALCSRARKVSECACAHSHRAADDGVSKSSMALSCSTTASSSTTTSDMGKADSYRGRITSSLSLSATKSVNTASITHSPTSLTSTIPATATQGQNERSSRTATTDFNADPTDSEVPFARRAREGGRSFHGGKCDDISVLVAVISPAETILN